MLDILNTRLRNHKRLMFTVLMVFWRHVAKTRPFNNSSEYHTTVPQKTGSCAVSVVWANDVCIESKAASLSRNVKLLEKAHVGMK